MHAFGLLASAVVGIALIAAWVVLAGSRFVQGGVVERPERVPQLYGYTVCLISLIWALVSAVAIAESALTLGAPAQRHEEFTMDPSVTSFEAFRVSYDRSRMMMSNGRDEKLDSIPEPELRRRYESIRADVIERNIASAKRDLIMAVLSLILAAGLFVFHWRWVGKRRLDGMTG